MQSKCIESPQPNDNNHNDRGLVGGDGYGGWGMGVGRWKVLSTKNVNSFIVLLAVWSWQASKPHRRQVGRGGAWPKWAGQAPRPHHYPFLTKKRERQIFAIYLRAISQRTFSLGFPHSSGGIPRQLQPGDVLMTLPVEGFNGTLRILLPHNISSTNNNSGRRRKRRSPVKGRGSVAPWLKNFSRAYTQIFDKHLPWKIFRCQQKIFIFIFVSYFFVYFCCHRILVLVSKGCAARRTSGGSCRSFSPNFHCCFLETIVIITSFA